MTDANSASGPTAAGSLAATIERVTALAAKLGKAPTVVLDPETLSRASGVPAAVVRTLLNGESEGEPDIQLRFLQRVALLQETHNGNGRKVTQADIARGTGISRQQINALLNGERRPTMDHCARIEGFFDRPAGFLQSQDTDALNNALVLLEKSLLEELAAREQAPAIYARHGVESIALRAALLPTDRDRQRVLTWLDQFMSELDQKRDEPES
ncbi:transcriptional regulator [Streptomyces sp. NPDC002952]|uniref:helix-turn-helix transcriptional regulator n=1 Tax=Streptomyces sp. NPDC002952 TaxID=3364673 RepID=UPI0036A335B9